MPLPGVIGVVEGKRSLVCVLDDVPSIVKLEGPLQEAVKTTPQSESGH